MRVWFLLIIQTILLAFAILHKRNEKAGLIHEDSKHSNPNYQSVVRSQNGTTPASLTLSDKVSMDNHYKPDNPNIIYWDVIKGTPNQDSTNISFPQAKWNTLTNDSGITIAP